MARIALVAAAFAVVAFSGEVSAMPRTPIDAGTGPVPTRIADSCGPGRSRDAAGRCHHHFNLFRHHERFKAYKRKHCTPVHTPTGTINRCKI